MKRFLSTALMVLAVAAIAGCGKKQEAEDMQPITMDSLSTMTAVSQVSPDLKTQEVKTLSPVTPAVTKELGALPPQGPYKPTGLEIQTAKASLIQKHIPKNCAAKIEYAITHLFTKLLANP